jgi:hypothetical protein
MADSNQPAVQPRATTPEGIKIEAFARMLLAAVIDGSVAEKREYGGVIFRHDFNGRLGATQAKGYSGTGVDAGTWNKNRGCPEGTTPVAWYHTHPTKNVVTPDFGTVPTDWEKFIEGDKLISDSFLLPGYVGTMDHRFWRYDPPPPALVNGKPVPAEGPGTYGVLNGVLVPQKLPRGTEVIQPVAG